MNNLLALFLYSIISIISLIFLIFRLNEKNGYITVKDCIYSVLTAITPLGWIIAFIIICININKSKLLNQKL